MAKTVAANRGKARKPKGDGVDAHPVESVKKTQAKTIHSAPRSESERGASRALEVSMARNHKARTPRAPAARARGWVALGARAVQG